jgi:hypothetical protein
MRHCSKQVLLATDWLAGHLAETIHDERGDPHVLGVYALHRTQHPATDHLLDTLKRYTYDEGIDERTHFWCDMPLEYTSVFLYLYEMGLANEERFQINWEWAKSLQTVNGNFMNNDYPSVLLPLVWMEPEGEQTKLAVTYYTKHWRGVAAQHPSRWRSVAACGLRALHHYDPYTYEDLIEVLAKHASAELNEMEPLEEVKHEGDFIRACLIVEAICEVYGPEVETAAGRIEEIKRLQRSDGAWPSFYGEGHPNSSVTPGPRILPTAVALLALVSAGEGPKVSVAELARQERLYVHKLESRRACVVATSPLDAIAEIRDVARELITGTENRLWICSRFITEYYTDIIQLHRDNENVDIRIITIPVKEARGVYVGHGKKFVEPAYHALQRNLTSGFKSTEILHARCIISDDTVLVSSADLTKEQLEHELNLGVWTRDPEVVENAVEVFETWWDSI